MCCPGPALTWAVRPLCKEGGGVLGLCEKTLLLLIRYRRGWSFPPQAGFVSCALNVASLLHMLIFENILAIKIGKRRFPKKMKIKMNRYNKMH
jgi:hypothetical protein